MCSISGIDKCTEVRGVVSETKGRFFCFHDWHIDKDNGFTQYRKCLKCTKRQVLQVADGYQEIDISYLREIKC